MNQIEALRELESPICNCGMSMSKNPHPDAGKPFTLCEIGAVWICIPCQSSTLHQWCGRALEAEKSLAIIKANTIYVNGSAAAALMKLLNESETADQSEKREIIDAYESRDEAVVVPAFIKIETVPEYRERTIRKGYSSHPKNQAHPKRYRK